MRPNLSHKPYTRLDMTIPVEPDIEIPYGDIEVQELGRSVIEDMSSEFNDTNFISMEDLDNIDKEVEEKLKSIKNKSISTPNREIDEFADPFFGQSSQRLLSDVQSMRDLIIPSQKSQKSAKSQTITVNPNNCSQYIEIQRKRLSVGVQCLERQQNMHQEYEEHENDHFLENGFSQLLSSQYHREMMKPFDDLEETITNISHAHLTKAATKTQPQIDIDWNAVNTFPPTPPARSPRPSTSKGISKNNEKPMVLKTAVLKPISSNFFADCGPFFGLPMLAWNLIKEYKQITELYGEFFFLK